MVLRPETVSSPVAVKLALSAAYGFSTISLPDAASTLEEVAFPLASILERLS